jgi:hypothetical protein
VPFDLDAWDELEERSTLQKVISDPFGRSGLHHFAWDFTREVTKPRSIILVVLWSIWRPLGGGRII